MVTNLIVFVAFLLVDYLVKDRDLVLEDDVDLS